MNLYVIGLIIIKLFIVIKAILNCCIEELIDYTNQYKKKKEILQVITIAKRKVVSVTSLKTQIILNQLRGG